MPVASVHELFVHELQDIYSAEGQIIKALPSMIKKAQDTGLKSGLEEHLEQTKEQVKRLDEVFKLIGEKAKAHACMAIQGILAEGKEALASAEKEMLDAAITGSAARVEHYEIVVYSSLIEMAKLMKHTEAVNLLKQTLEEEKTAGTMMEQGMKMALKAAPLGM